MNDSSVVSSKLVFFSDIFLKKIKEGVCSSIHFTLTIINSKIVTRELLCLVNLTRAQTLCIYKLLKVIIVCKNGNLVFAVF